MIDLQRPQAIRSADSRDAAAVAAIYNYYVMNTVVSFEEEAVPESEMARRIEEVEAFSLPWLVADDGDVAGFAYATRWKSRSAYRFSAEVAVYVAHDRLGRTIGSRLYAALFPILAARGVHTVIGGVALPNDASIALHERFGFRKVAHFHDAGFKQGRWIDVGYWQLTL